MQQPRAEMEKVNASHPSAESAQPPLNVAVLGASNNPERYSHMAVVKLLAHGHNVFPVNPGLRNILPGLEVFANLADLPARPHTLTLYVNPERSNLLADAILAANPRRVIFNPGSENPVLAERLRRHNIEALNACTLLLLSMGRFAVPPEQPLPKETATAEDPNSASSAEDRLNGERISL